MNSHHSRITLDTRNVLIEVTATDKTKMETVTSILVAMFSVYCDDPFTYVNTNPSLVFAYLAIPGSNPLKLYRLTTTNLERFQP